MRALRLARYGGRATVPDRAQRRALRRELGLGLGPLGRLRALRALPPRLRGAHPYRAARPARQRAGRHRTWRLPPPARLHSNTRQMDDVYDLYQRGTELLEAGHHHAAVVPLSRAAEFAPDKTSVREALGRALFHSQQYERAAIEFQAVVDRAPTNDFALFCLGRCLQLLGRHADARKPLTLAACMQPDRRDYRLYRDRARAAAARTSDACCSRSSSDA